jgi:catechol O-methyltransferase
MEHVIATTTPRDPEAVLRALDAFGRREFLMNIGDEKGPILTAAIEKSKPRFVLELGCVCASARSGLGRSSFS